MALDTAKATAILRDLTQKFDSALGEYTPFYPRICTVRPSNRRDENYGWIGALPGVREWIGERVFNQLAAAKYLLANKNWEDSIAIDRFDLADDILGMYDLAFPMLGEEAAKHPDTLLFNAVINGETQACFDGQYFFSASHAWGSSGTQSNLLAATAATPTIPTSAEWKKAFTAALIKMFTYKNDKGLLMNRPVMAPTRVVALVPPTQWQGAKEAMEAVIISNTTNINIGVCEVIPIPFLTTGTKWYLLNVDSRLRPFIFQAREPVTRYMKGLDDREFKNVKFMTEARYNVGYLAWWNAVLTTFS